MALFAADNLRYNREHMLQKKSELGKQWNAHVYERIRDDIKKQVQYALLQNRVVLLFSL